MRANAHPGEARAKGERAIKCTVTVIPVSDRTFVTDPVASDAVVAEYSSGGALQGRYVFAGMNEPIVSYDNAGNRTWLAADERGSIIAAVNASGAASAIYSYDEYGVPAASNAGRFGYTGQVRLPEVVEAGLYYYKNRMYLSPVGGRFMQPDPIGYAGGANLYPYVGNDPVNLVDPLGTDKTLTTNCKLKGSCTPPPPPPTGTRIPGGISPQLFGSIGNGTVGFPLRVSLPSTGGICENGTCTDITATGPYYVWIEFGDDQLIGDFQPNPWNDAEPCVLKSGCRTIPGEAPAAPPRKLSFCQKLKLAEIGTAATSAILALAPTPPTEVGAGILETISLGLSGVSTALAANEFIACPE